MRDVHEIIPAFCLSLVVYLVISKLTARHRPPEDYLDRIF